MLVPVLKHNFALQSLNLDSNCLTGSGIKVIHVIVIVIPWTQVVCLICTPKGRGCAYLANHKWTWYNCYVP